MNISRSYHFLKELKENNNKIWFDLHRTEYQELRDQLKELAFGVMTQVAEFDTTINFPSDIRLFRINRDIRFSKNKQPYKTNFGVTIASHGKMDFNPGYYFHISPEKSFVGGGWYEPDTSLLPKIRLLISKKYHEFEEIMNMKEIQRYFPSGLTQFEDTLKSAPRGFDKNDPALELLKRKHFILSESFDFEAAKDLQKDIIDRYKAISHVNEFLQKVNTEGL